MVKITNGVNVFEVSEGAFESIYKLQGYTKINDKKSASVKKDEVAPEKVEKIDATDKFTELEEKPISQWSKSEVKAYAEANDIDLSGTKNVGEAKELIKAAMSSSEDEE